MTRHDKPARLESLTIFRFIAALIVINFHFGKTLYDWPRILIAGSEMVTFFFVLSGFVMSYSYLPKERIKMSEFWTNRIKRLAPAYYAALILSLLFIFQENDIVSLLLGIVFLQSWIPPHAPRLNGPAWSVSVEVFFYAVFPLIVWIIRRKSFSVVQVCIAACVTWLVSEIVLLGLLNSGVDVNPPSAYYYLIYFFPLSYFSSFVLGIAGGMWLINHSRYDKWYFSLSALVIALIIIQLINNQTKIQSVLGLERVDANILSPFYLLFILFLAQGTRLVNDWLGKPPFRRLGEASYAMYILQLPIWALCVRFFSTLFENPQALIIFYLAVLIGTSLLFSRYVDGYISGKSRLNFNLGRY